MGNTYLLTDNIKTLRQLTEKVGADNIGDVLNVNGIERQKNVISAYNSKCEDIISSTETVDWKRKAEVLNSLSTDSDVFEYAAMQSEDGWKVLSETMAFQDALLIPDAVELVRYNDVLGNGEPVSASTYNTVMQHLAKYETIPEGVFAEYSTIKPVKNVEGNGNNTLSQSDYWQWFKIPWGEVTLSSQLSGESMDIPAYPEELTPSYKASYDTMPDVLYQYEPWYVFNSSGPREESIKFHLHRHMWTGDETDDKANQLLRFMQASLYPEYSGSQVNTDIVTLYISGSPYIRGIETGLEVEWGGPIGQDGWYLEFTVTLTISEVSNKALNYDVVRSMPLIGN